MPYLNDDDDVIGVISNVSSTYVLLDPSRYAFSYILEKPWI